MGKTTRKRKPKIDDRMRRSDETFMQWLSRLTQLDIEAKDKEGVVINPFAAAHGEYRDVFIHHDETSTKTRTKRNRVCNILEKWVDEGGIGFEAGAITVIRNCQKYWEKIGNPKVTANYGERIYGSNGNGLAQHEAQSQLNHYQSLLDVPQYWRIFENVVRHNQPAGIAGSDLAINPATRIASAKTVVGLVASHIASKMNY